MTSCTRFLLVALVVSLCTAEGRPGPRAVDARPRDGAIATWVWHLDGRMLDLSLPSYADLLREIPADARIVVAAGCQADARLFGAGLGLDLVPDHRIRFVACQQPLTSWARDRYVFFRKKGRPHVLLPPSESCPGDRSIGSRLRRWHPNLVVVETGLELEGGNVLVTPNRVFVGAGAVGDNSHLFNGNTDFVREELEEIFERRVVVVGDHAIDLPHEHLDMFLAAVGDRRLLLGDPGLALPYFDRVAGPGDVTDPGGIGALRRETQLEARARYRRLAARLTAAGFQVTGIPILHSESGEIVTWTNAVLERRADGLHAYVPDYGIPALDRQAHAVWREAGYRVHAIQAEGVITQGGAVRCLSNVLYESP